MKYKIIVLTIISLIGISSLALSRDNNGSRQYLYGDREPVYDNNSFKKGDMIAFNWDFGSNDTESNETEDDDKEGLAEDIESDEDIEESDEDEIKASSTKKRKSHDMSVESGKHGKSHNLLNDAFFYIPEDVQLADGLLHTRNVGLAKTLRGSICVCTFFVSEKNWKNDQYHKLYKQNLEIA